MFPYLYTYIIVSMLFASKEANRMYILPFKSAYIRIDTYKRKCIPI